MTHILLELKHIEKVIEDFAMKHLHMGSYKTVSEAKADLHAALIAQSVAPEVAIEPPNQVPVAIVPDEQPDATLQAQGN